MVAVEGAGAERHSLRGALQNTRPGAKRRNPTLVFDTLSSAFPMRPAAPSAVGDSGISRFSRMEIPRVRGSATAQGRPSSRDHDDVRVAFRFG